MATWEDGPEYAPSEPPAEFTVPDVPPLSSPPPVDELPPAPTERPHFGNPDQPVAALTSLVPAVGEEPRDPRSPFDVAGTPVTGGGDRGGAWGAAHLRPPTGQPVVPGQPAPGVAAGPMHLHASAASSVGNLPAPGTPAWFGPGPQVRPYRQQAPSTWKASPPGAIIVLIISIVWVLAPFTFLLAFALSARARYARKPILTAFAIIGTPVVLIATVSTLGNDGDFGTWYNRLCGWALFGSVLMIILIIAFVRRELKRTGGRPPGSGGGASPTGPFPFKSDPSWPWSEENPPRNPQ